MFFNESVTEAVDTNVNLGISGKFFRLDMLNDSETVEESNGNISLNLFVVFAILPMVFVNYT